MKSLKESYVDVPFATDTSWYAFCALFADFHGCTWAANKI